MQLMVDKELVKARDNYWKEFCKQCLHSAVDGDREKCMKCECKRPTEYVHKKEG